MSWVKNGLLLGAGGVIGLVIAAWLESEGKFDDDLFRVQRESRREPSTEENIESLIEKNS